ncbi:MAG: adenylosuccinate lyase [Candidatus Margulisbacteria bacterium]|nr:adenylosuccinate lyase [Candidatus Margulisiibacteriota bacterium]MBU1022543.1 adenylosuccinate lyase [Candidatus Margulisiibacteriota bacterium]MBU1728829.1 adenylosuccinate lyase [Candidatus Margulisiibacteriota bacterium]MBU1768005.1 adenylosuccinate lyase [Candidatus Omnitrophota bacterium]MBU1955795.1 adenylosuccinate lyase [Candidatus Margulisiibacteriota bacterium]
MIDRYTTPEMRKIWSEQNKFQTWLDVELAVCKAWTQLGKIPKKALNKILKKASFSIKRIDQIEKVTDHDMIAFLTAVAEKVGPDSRFIHMGLTSTDVVDSSLGLLLKQSIDIIQDDLKTIIKTLKKQAKANKNTVMVGRSHGIHAEPTTFALKLALYMEEMKRNLERINRAKEAVCVCKLSGAVGTYSNLDPRVETIASKVLGLNSTKIATQTLQRDRHAELMATLAIIAGTIEKISVEIRGLQRTEIDEVEEPFKKGQKGSSAMPHKKNPISCERLTGMARMVRANAMVAFENIALWHERDISHSSTERMALPDSIMLIDYMLKKMNNILDRLVIKKKHMLRNLDLTGGLIYSQRLLLALVGKGLTREKAYKIVQRNAMQAKDTEQRFVDIVASDPEVSSLLSFDELHEVFNTDYYLRNVKVIYKRLGI